MPEDKQGPKPEGQDALTRRHLLKGAGAFALTAASAPLLSACGGGGSSSNSSAGSVAKNGQATGGIPVAELRQMLGITDADAKALNGKELKLGLVTALTGSGAE